MSFLGNFVKTYLLPCVITNKNFSVNVYTISEGKFPTENISEFPLREGGRIENLKISLKIARILIKAHHATVQIKRISVMYLVGPLCLSPTHFNHH